MQSCKAGETTDYRPLGDHETILPGDVWQDHTGAWEPVGEHYPAHCTPAECSHRFRRPTPRPTPATDPGEGWRLLGDDEVTETGDQALTSRFGWATISLAEGLTRAESLWAAVRRRDPLTPAAIHRVAIHRAAITGNTHDDCLPAMRYGVNCVDGHRRHAASYEDACRVFDEAVRATLARRGGQS